MSSLDSDEETEDVTMVALPPPGTIRLKFPTTTGRTFQQAQLEQNFAYFTVFCTGGLYESKHLHEEHVLEIPLGLPQWDYLEWIARLLEPNPIGLLCEAIKDWYALWLFLDFLQLRKESPVADIILTCLTSVWGLRRERGPWPEPRVFWSAFLTANAMNLSVAFPSLCHWHKDDTFRALRHGLLAFARECPDWWKRETLVKAMREYESVTQRTDPFDLLDPLIQHLFNRLVPLDPAVEQCLSRTELLWGSQVWASHLGVIRNRIEALVGQEGSNWLHAFLSPSCFMVDIWDVLFEPWVLESAVKRGHRLSVYPPPCHAIKLVCIGPTVQLLECLPPDSVVLSPISANVKNCNHHIIAIPGWSRNLLITQYLNSTEARASCFYTGDRVVCTVDQLNKLGSLISSEGGPMRCFIQLSYGFFTLRNPPQNKAFAITSEHVLNSYELLSPHPSPEEKSRVRFHLRTTFTSLLDTEFTWTT